MLDTAAFLPSEIRLPIRPNDIDYAAYLNNAVYVEFLEAGRVDWAERNRIDLGQTAIAPAVVRLELDYLRGIVRGREGMEVIVRTRLADAKLARLTFEQEILNTRLEASARAVVQVVMLDWQKHRAVSVSEALDRLRR